MAVLGVSITSRMLCIAIVKDNELYDFQSRRFSGPWSRKKANEMVLRFKGYLKKYNVTHVALAIPSVHHEFKETKIITTVLKTNCIARNIPVSEYNQKSFDCFYQEARAKKKEMMKQLALLYPELKPLFKKEIRSNKRRYFVKLFEAVAAATILNQELQQ